MRDVFANPEVRLHALVALFAVAAGIRLIYIGLSTPTRRWSLVVGGTLVALCVARELPRFL